MVYLGFFYKDNGTITLQEFVTINAIKTWWKENKEKYITYDIYMAKCINKRIRLEAQYDKYIRSF